MSDCCGPEGMRHGFRKVMENCCQGEEGKRFEKMMHMGFKEFSGIFERRFKTREEKVSGLEEYLSDLESEAAAVREAIADLKPA